MRRLLFLVSLCAILFFVVGGLFVRDVFFVKSNNQLPQIEIVIEQGSSVRKIAQQLKNEHIISHPTFFQWFVVLSRMQNKLQAGMYVFSQNSSITEIVFILSNPKNTDLKITIPEGFTNQQIKIKLTEVFPEFDVLGWDAQTKELEGFLFPDTYQFSKNVTVSEIIQEMRSTLDRRLVENGIDFTACEKYDPSMGYVSPTRCSLQDTLILASIIEKEVQTPEDMKHVAGILFNRLKIGMPLQVDSTLTYVTEKSSAELTTADLKMASPYNTYTHKGLPPTPICNPGMNAILAALNPTPSKDFYFLTTKENKVIYAQTHDQHVANKQKYLK